MQRPIFILLLLLIAISSPWEPVHSEEISAHRTVTFPSGTKFDAEVADTPEARRIGLMFRDRLPAGGGMLFIFPQAAPYKFWMKNCKFPIDIIWLNEAKEIIYISEKTPPCQSEPCPLYGPIQQNALYVLEVASGFTQREHLKLGMNIQF